MRYACADEFKKRRINKIESGKGTGNRSFFLNSIFFKEENMEETKSNVTLMTPQELKGYLKKRKKVVPGMTLKEDTGIPKKWRCILSEETKLAIQEKFPEPRSPWHGTMCGDIVSDHEIDEYHKAVAMRKKQIAKYVLETPQKTLGEVNSR